MAPMLTVVDTRRKTGQITVSSASRSPPPPQPHQVPPQMQQQGPNVDLPTGPKDAQLGDAAGAGDDDSLRGGFFMLPKRELRFANSFAHVEEISEGNKIKVWSDIEDTEGLVRFSVEEGCDNVTGFETGFYFDNHAIPNALCREEGRGNIRVIPEKAFTKRGKETEVSLGGTKLGPAMKIRTAIRETLPQSQDGLLGALANADNPRCKLQFFARVRNDDNKAAKEMRVPLCSSPQFAVVSKPSTKAAQEAGCDRVEDILEKRKKLTTHYARGQSARETQERMKDPSEARQYGCSNCGGQGHYSSTCGPTNKKRSKKNQTKKRSKKNQTTERKSKRARHPHAVQTSPGANSAALSTESPSPPPPNHLGGVGAGQRIFSDAEVVEAQGQIHKQQSGFAPVDGSTLPPQIDFHSWQKLSSAPAEFASEVGEFAGIGPTVEQLAGMVETSPQQLQAMSLSPASSPRGSSPFASEIERRGSIDLGCEDEMMNILDGSIELDDWHNY